MPLLNKQPFVPEAAPSDVRPDEEVFVCQATKEVFRDYERFFTRHFLCNSLVWTCELTGATSLTYTQALDSEKEARKVLDSLAPCYQQAALSLVHHARRTNVRTLADEICAFYRERFIMGEEVNFTRRTTSGAKVICSVRVVNTILPTPKVKSPSPIKVPVISLSPLKALPPLSPPRPAASDVKAAEESGVGSQSPTPNGLPSSDGPRETTPKTRSPRTPKTPLPPLSAELSLNPMDYLYVVELIESPEVKLQVPAKQLSRTKGTLTPRKLKLFLRNALVRPSERHPLIVKEEYVEKFNLGPCTAEILLSPTTSARKRSLSQSNLESFFTPGSQSKRPRPTSLDALKKRKERKKTPKTPKGAKSKARRSSASKTPKSVSKLPATPRSPGKTPKSPRNKMEALKALNKAKKYKQMDLKKAVVRNVGLTEVEIAEMKRRTEEEREKRAAAREAEKQRRKEERQRRLQENWERKRRERMRQVEWMKPREDTLCEDSKPLPDPDPVATQLPADLFGEAVMLLEFLHTFGPLFNIREVIPTTITFGRLEYALVSKDPDSLLYEVAKFLLQAVFAIMEEEKESQVNVYVGDSVTELEGKAEGVETESADCEDQASEGAEALMEEEMGEERKGLDVRVETVKASASLFAKWPFLTQRSVLSELVLDPFTCSEILRLHLLASGGYTDVPERRFFRVHRRGNYTDADDPSIALRLRRPDLLEALAQSCIYDLPPVDKLELLSTLCSQLLTYSVSREHMEEAAHRAKMARKAIREVLRSEDRREKEEARLKKTKQKVNVPVTCDPPLGGLPVEGSAPVQAGEPEAIAAQESRSSPADGAGKNADTGRVETAEGEEQRKLRIAGELKELNEELVEASAMVNLQPIGTDRHHRKYWHFLSLPGLYVEDSGRFPTPPSSRQSPSDGGQPPLQQPRPPDAVDLTGSPCKPLPPPLIHESQIEPPPQMGNPQTPPSQLNWACYCSPEVIDTLLASLNPRGLREVVLGRMLEKTKGSILRSVSRCPFAPGRQRSPTPPPKYSSAEQFMELYLREQVLDMEEKIYLGTLGALKGVEDRLEWRESIENSGAAAQLACDVDEAGQSVQAVAAVNPSVRELSQALLQVQAGIESKFLMPPLGVAVDEKNQKRGKKNGVVKESDLCLEQWRASLVKATSFSQIYLHLSTLERAVMWSKSLMNVRCRICRRKTGDEFLLLCDGCDHGYHTYCLRPPLGTIPEGDWFCYNCIPVTPVKPKRQARKLVIVEEESSEEEEEEEGETEEEENESESEEEQEMTVTRKSLRSRNRENQRPSGRRTRMQASKVVKARGKSHQNLRKKVPKRKESKSPESSLSGEQSQAKRKLKLDHFQSRTESAIASVIELKCLRHGRQSSAGRREERGLEMQVCEALWEEVSRHEDSIYFAAPVKKKEFPDYHEVVAEPMDLRTVRSKIKWNKYNSVEEFLFDMDLIFSNCLSFHKRHSTVGRAGSALQKFFGKRCNDLGIRELLCGPKQN